MKHGGALSRRVGAGTVFVVAVVTLAGARGAAAADTTVAAGASLTFTDDIVLSGSDSFMAGAAGGARCTIDGAGHSLRTMDGWTGHIVIASCDASNLGSGTAPAIDVVNAGAGAGFDVRDSVFETSGQIYVESFTDMSFVFRGNTIAASSVVTVLMNSVDGSQPSFHFRGNGGPSQKLFQGNRVLRSWVQIEAGQNWLIGGSTPADGNIIVGQRAGLQLAGNAIVARGNYLSIPLDSIATWNQLALVNANGEDGALLLEHNVIRNSNWLVRTFGGGELRYNLLADAFVVSWVLLTPDAKARVHHNVMVRNHKLLEEPNVKVTGIEFVDPAKDPSVEVYNNTLDGSGYCYDVFGPAVSIDPQSFLASLRSNVFYNLPTDDGATNTALVAAGPTSGPIAKGDPGPALLGYADYNLFDNPKARQVDNYGISVAGLTERTSPGFALNDATVGGAKDEQVEPGFTGPLPTVFPFNDEDVIAGTVTVCQILAFYRAIYTPKAGSPVVDKGDPADGAGNDIGAVGAGMNDPADLFGRLCSDADNVLPSPPTVQTTCPQPIVMGGGSGTGGSGPPGGRGFVCVCEIGSSGSAVHSLAVLAGLIVVARARRRRPR